MTNQENSPVKVKGMADGLCITLDPTQPEDFLQKELEKQFNPLKHLAINARIIFDVGEDDKGCKTLVEKLGEFLKKNFSVGSVSLSPKKRWVSEEKYRHQDMDHSWQQYRSDVLMLTGRVRSGQKVTARKHLIILGDVNPGAEVVGGGDVFVMGSLSGTAIAGYPDNEKAIVLALDFRPTQIQIGGLVAAGLPPSSEKVAEFAHVENGTIVVEDYLKVNPFGRIPWPEVR